jgi:hypothetical protein
VLRAGPVVWRVLALWLGLLVADWGRPSVYGAGAGAQGWNGAHRSGQAAEALLSRHDEAAAQDPEMEEGVVRAVGVDARG